MRQSQAMKRMEPMTVTEEQPITGTPTGEGKKRALTIRIHVRSSHADVYQRSF